MRSRGPAARDRRRPSRESSEEPELAGRERAHLQEQPAVPEARDIGLSVFPLVVPDRQVDDAQVEPRRPEEQVEVAERIEVPEVSAVRRDPLIVLPEEHLRSAEGVPHLLPEEPAEEEV